MTQAQHAAVSRFPVPELNDMPEDIRARILAVQEKSGFIPNVFLTLGHNLGLHDMDHFGDSTGEFSLTAPESTTTAV